MERASATRVLQPRLWSAQHGEQHSLLFADTTFSQRLKSYHLCNLQACEIGAVWPYYGLKVSRRGLQHCSPKSRQFSEAFNLCLGSEAACATQRKCGELACQNGQ